MRKNAFYLVLVILATIMVVPGVFAEGKVVVYSTNQQAQNDMMATEFEKDTGIKCEMVRAGSGITLKRIRAEKDRPLGDVALGLSKILLNGNLDLWEAYKIKDWDVYPAEFKDPNGLWIGQMVHVMVFIYNTKQVSAAEAPKNWGDFLDPKWQDRVAYCNPNNSGSAYTQLTVMLQLWGGGDQAWQKVETLLKHAKVTQQSSLVYKGVAQGEFPAGITMEYAGYRYKKGGASPWSMPDTVTRKAGQRLKSFIRVMEPWPTPKVLPSSRAVKISKTLAFSWIGPPAWKLVRKSSRNSCDGRHVRISILMPWCREWFHCLR
jgi:iron(III) transport system substrate-binding protein